MHVKMPLPVHLAAASVKLANNNQTLRFYLLSFAVKAPRKALTSSTKPGPTFRPS